MRLVEGDPYVIRRLISRLKGGLEWLSESHQAQLPLDSGSELLKNLQDPQRMASLVAWVQRDLLERQGRFEASQARALAPSGETHDQREPAAQEAEGSQEAPRALEPPERVKLTALPGVELTVEIWGLDRFSSFEEPPPTLERPPERVVEVMRPIGALAQRWSQLYGHGAPLEQDSAAQSEPLTAHESPVAPATNPGPSAPSAGFGSWLTAPVQRPSAPQAPSVAPQPPSPTLARPEPAVAVSPPQELTQRFSTAPALSPELPAAPTLATRVPITVEAKPDPSELFSGWKTYERALHACRACPRSQQRAEREWAVVGGVGSWSPLVMFVESHPSAYGAESGLPLADLEIARAFNKTLMWLGLSRHSVYTTALLKCSTEDPKRFQWEACRAHFERELSLLQPKFIVSLGVLTTQILLSQDEPMIGEWYEVAGTPVLGTHHFSDAVAQGAFRLKREMGDHLKRLKLRLEQLDRPEEGRS